MEYVRSKVESDISSRDIANMPSMTFKFICVESGANTADSVLLSLRFGHESLTTCVYSTSCTLHKSHRLWFQIEHCILCA